MPKYTKEEIAVFVTNKVVINEIQNWLDEKGMSYKFWESFPKASTSSITLDYTDKQFKRFTKWMNGSCENSDKKYFKKLFKAIREAKQDGFDTLYLKSK